MIITKVKLKYNSEELFEYWSGDVPRVDEQIETESGKKYTICNIVWTIKNPPYVTLYVV